ncbi:MAG: manganese transport protein [Rhodospirillaceae bacterium]|jgi:manganese transport protein|nr:manganese transport protein [Rhodospirillaceae bacterium]
MDTISGRRPLEGAAVGGAAALTAAAPVSSAASAGRLASRFGRPWFPSWRRLIGTAGPGLLIAVGYIDPGNWATDLGGGSRYGYALLSMVLIANLIAMVAQALCVRLAIATGKSLAELSREAYSRPVVLLLWLLAEVAMVATDLAELVGGAIALKLLFGMDLVPGILLMSVGTLVLLFGRDDWRWLRGLVCGLVVVIAASFAALLCLAPPDWAMVATGFVPTPALIADPVMLLLGIGIIGATVMPHNLYLHSGLLAPAGRALDRGAKQGAIKANVRDSNVSLGLALLINAAILIAAGAIFHARGLTEIADLGAAYALLNPVLGSSIAATIFAIGLLAAGQSSTITGTLAGQLVMEGFLQIRLSPLVRRLLTRLAALGPVLLYFAVVGESDTTRLLVLSQVVLSLQLPFAMVPLLRFVGLRRLMGDFVLGRAAKIGSWGLALLILALNATLIFEMLT